MTSTVDIDNDLPLMANIKDIRVKHFILDLACNFESRTLSGCIILLLEPVELKSCEDDGSSFRKHHKTDNQNAEFESLKDRTEQAKNSGRIETCVENASHNSKDTYCNFTPLKGSSDGFSVSDVTSDYANNTIDSKPEKLLRVKEQSAKDTSHNDILDKIYKNSDDFFVMTLDSCDISVKLVSEIILPKDFKPDDIKYINPNTSKYPSLCKDVVKKNSFAKKIDDFKKEPMQFEVESWCVKVWKTGCKDVAKFPRIIQICYDTNPDGRSLKWTKDQAGKPCVYTYGSWLNNRAWFPCQDIPSSMSTWQATVYTPLDASTLMTGQHNEVVWHNQNGCLSHYYGTTMELPCSTLALAIGYWKKMVVKAESEGEMRKIPDFCEAEGQGHYCTVNYYSESQLPCRIFAPDNCFEKCTQEFAAYLPRCFDAAYNVLGPHPFLRLDILLVPQCFGSMALASPNLLFISQSLLAGDGSMLVHLAHELSHSWFGLLIGPLDWTEEWMTEGFATFMEGHIHALANGWSKRDADERSSLQTVLKYHTLAAEVQNTDQTLQMLRPNQGLQVSDPSTSIQYVKHGMNPDKAFMQVHYLKGFFLLRYLESLVGEQQFLGLIKSFVKKYHGQLVLSKHFFSLVLDSFPELRVRGITVQSINKQWLDCPGMPVARLDIEQCKETALYKQVECEFEKWKMFNKTSCQKNKKRRLMNECKEDNFVKLIPDQLVLLLELLLEEESISKQTLAALHNIYCLSSQNGNIRHRWCELIVKHQYHKGYEDVRHFLIEDQAMGVYLYGECMVSENKTLQSIARECFQQTSQEMEPSVLKTVREMLYGE